MVLTSPCEFAVNAWASSKASLRQSADGCVTCGCQALGGGPHLYACVLRGCRVTVLQLSVNPRYLKQDSFMPACVGRRPDEVALFQGTIRIPVQYLLKMRLPYRYLPIRAALPHVIAHMCSTS